MVFFAVLILAVICAVFSFFVWLLWGPVAVDGLGLPDLSYLQCFGLLVLCRLLVGINIGSEVKKER